MTATVTLAKILSYSNAFVSQYVWEIAQVSSLGLQSQTFLSRSVCFLSLRFISALFKEQSFPPGAKVQTSTCVHMCIPLTFSSHVGMLSKGNCPYLGRCFKASLNVFNIFMLQNITFQGIFWNPKLIIIFTLNKVTPFPQDNLGENVTLNYPCHCCFVATTFTSIFANCWVY